jgi:hypothetical protein
MLISVIFAVSVAYVQNIAAFSPPQATVSATGIRRIQVDAQAIKSLPTGKKYVLDLRKRGVKYELDPKGDQLDFSRVTVRTARGEFPIASFLERNFLKDKLADFKYTSQSFSLGSAPAGPSRTPTATQVIACRDIDICSCTGDDCDDLIRSTLCGDVYFCVHNPITKDVVCSCARRVPS